jgi:hypothetical protein
VEVIPRLQKYINSGEQLSVQGYISQLSLTNNAANFFNYREELPSVVGLKENDGKACSTQVELANASLMDC